MTNVHDLVASVLYQDVQIAQNLSFSELSMENAVLEMPEPLPVASELSVRIDHPEGQVLGAAIVTRVRESRGAGEAGQLHLRWVEFSNADFSRLAEWVSMPGSPAPKKPEPKPVVEAAPEPVVEAAPEPVVEAAPEPVVEAAPEPVVEAAAAPSFPDAIPGAPVADEIERTIPIDPGATSLDLPAITETMPNEDTAAHEGSADGSGEEISVVDEEGAQGSEDGGTSSEDGGTSSDKDGADKKKSRRRSKKK